MSEDFVCFPAPAQEHGSKQADEASRMPLRCHRTEFSMMPSWGNYQEAYRALQTHFKAMNA